MFSLETATGVRVGVSTDLDGSGVALLDHRLAGPLGVIAFQALYAEVGQPVTVVVDGERQTLPHGDVISMLRLSQ